MDTHFVRACAVEKHVKTLQEKCCGPESAQNADTHFVQAGAVEMHCDMSQEPLYTEIYGKNAADQSEHPDQAPAFTATVRTPQCGLDTLFGELCTCSWCLVRHETNNFCRMYFGS